MSAQFDNVTYGAGEIFTADKILKKRSYKGRIEYLIKWEGFSSKHNSWEPADNILDPELLHTFNKRKSLRKLRKSLKKSSSRKLQGHKSGQDKKSLNPLKFLSVKVKTTTLYLDTPDDVDDDDDDVTIYSDDESTSPSLSSLSSNFDDRLWRNISAESSRDERRGRLPSNGGEKKMLAAAAMTSLRWPTFGDVMGSQWTLNKRDVYACYTWKCIPPKKRWLVQSVAA